MNPKHFKNITYIITLLMHNAQEDINKNNPAGNSIETESEDQID